MEERQDVGVLHLGRGLDLDDEPLGAEDGGKLGLQDLDRDLAVVLQVLGQVDGGHATLAERPLDSVAAGQRLIEATGRIK